MSSHTRNIRGGSGLVINVTGVDINLTDSNTVTSNVVTSMGAVFANGTINLLDKINTKQNTVDGTTNLTVLSLAAGSITASGNIQGDSITCDNNILTDSLTATADIACDNFNAIGDISCSTLTSSDIVTTDLIIDTDLLVVDSINRKVGINKSLALGYTLDVNGTINSSGNLSSAAELAIGGVNKQFLVKSGGNVISNNSLSIYPGYKGITALNNYCTYSLPGATKTHYFDNNMEIENDLAVNGDLNLTGNIPSMDLQQVYDNSTTAQIQIDNINDSIQIQGSGDVLHCLRIKNEFGAYTSGITRDGTIQCVDLTVDNTLLTTNSNTNRVGINKAAPVASLDVVGDANFSTTLNVDGEITSTNLAVDTNLIKTDSINNRVGINKSIPNYSLDVVGDGNISSNFSVAGLLNAIDINALGDIDIVDIRASGAIDAIGDITSAGDVVIRRQNFTNGTLRQYRFDCTTSPANTMAIRWESAGAGGSSYSSLDVLTMTPTGYINIPVDLETGNLTVSNGGSVELNNCDLTTTGDISGNLNSTRGQILSFMGENGNYSSWSTGQYVFKFGNGSTSTDTFGILIPGNFKMKKWMYSCIAGSILTTSTKLVFDIIMNDTVVCYCIVDFSLSTASTTYFKATGKFSSSATSQVDSDYSHTGPAYGTNISYRVNSNTVTSGFNFTDHRMSTFVETTENW